MPQPPPADGSRSWRCGSAEAELDAEAEETLAQLEDRVERGATVMAERRLEGLQRVLGVYPLASSAYGNVGSSIYYALGLVASLALGLTPVVFIISGCIFFLTASTYAEATAMFPEAGGSSRFARHAFNEFWSFFAAWGQMLNYMLTIATRRSSSPTTSAACSGRRSGTPRRRVAGIVTIVVLARDQHPRGRGVDRREPGAGRDRLLHPGADRAGRPVPGLLAADPGQQRAPRAWRPTWGNFLVAIPLCMLAYTGIETISNMSEEAKNPGQDGARRRSTAW